MSDAAFFLPEIEEVETEREVFADRRTPVPFPSKHPDGRSWEDYFADYYQARKAARRVKAGEPEDGEDDEAAEEDGQALDVLIWGHNMTDEERKTLSSRGSVAQVAKRLGGQGWDVTIRHSRAIVPAVLYVTSSAENAEIQYSAGDVRTRPRLRDTYVLIAVKRASGSALALEASWDITTPIWLVDGHHIWWRTDKPNSKFRIARTYDPFLGYEVRVGYQKGRPANQIELEEGITAPLGLEEWLHIVAPTKTSIAAAAKKKAKAAEVAAANVGFWSAE